MRKLKLQMQTTADGFVAGPSGQLDWMSRDLDEPLIAFINRLIDTSDTILLGRKMTPGFISYWEDVLAKPDSREQPFAKKMVGMPKVVFEFNFFVNPVAIGSGMKVFKGGSPCTSPRQSPTRPEWS
jgi:dihydrofolate reductase